MQVGLAFAGIVGICLSIPFAYGLAAIVGVPFGPLNSILPCLILGLGVDDMFVIVQSYENLGREEKQSPLAKRIGKTMRHAGSSITVTSLTDFAAFIVGGTSVSIQGIELSDYS